MKVRENSMLKDYLILYIDILGTKEALKKVYNDCDAEYEYLEHSRKVLNGLNDYLNKSIDRMTDNMNEDSKKRLNLKRFNCLIWSDNAIIFAEYNKRDISDMGNLYYNLASIIGNYIIYVDENTFLRGAFTEGKLMYDSNSNFISGSGLIRAYELEESAVYPRIVFDNRLESTNILVVQKKDKIDNLYIVDYLMNGFCSINKDVEDSEQIFKNVLQQKYKVICDRMIQFYDNHKIFIKYAYLKNYYDEFFENKKQFSEIIVDTNQLLMSIK